jgi:hypothetical protein
MSSARRPMSSTWGREREDGGVSSSRDAGGSSPVSIR